MNFKNQFLGRSSIALVGLVSFFISNCGYSDTRNLPSKIKVSAVTSGGYHVHAEVGFHASNPIKFLCTGVFGEGLKYESDTYNDISKSGVEFKLKKSWSGICNYRFSVIEVVCTKTTSFPERHDGSFQSAHIGILDTSENFQSFRENTFQSDNKILDSTLFVKVNGIKSLYWGCKDDCENEEDFGVNASNSALTINCGEN